MRRRSTDAVQNAMNSREIEQQKQESLASWKAKIGLASKQEHEHENFR